MNHNDNIDTSQKTDLKFYVNIQFEYHHIVSLQSNFLLKCTKVNKNKKKFNRR